jgi:hypothetical protein
MRLRFAALLLAIGTTLGLVSVSAVPDRASATATATCQYRVNTYSTIRSTPGGATVANAYTGDLANISDRSNSSWYYGNYYYYDAVGNPVWYASGYILSSHLDNLNRCF